VTSSSEDGCSSCMLDSCRVEIVFVCDVGCVGDLDWMGCINRGGEDELLRFANDDGVGRDGDEKDWTLLMAAVAVTIDDIREK
jgi:hypothetical protein